MRKRHLLIMYMDGVSAELDCDVVTDKGDSLVASVYEDGVKSTDTVYPHVNVRSIVIRYHHDARPEAPAARFEQVAAVVGASDDTLIVDRSEAHGRNGSV